MIELPNHVKITFWFQLFEKTTTLPIVFHEPSLNVMVPVLGKLWLLQYNELSSFLR